MFFCLTTSNRLRNMFLAAAPYFQRRFESSDRLLQNFQSSELVVSTVGSLGSIIILTRLQSNASYPKRIIASLGINIVVFTVLAMSTRLFLGVSAGAYFAFLMIAVFSTSLATALCQNGLFAYVSSFGREEYTQGIMVGQGIAGVLPCIAQIVSVLSVSESKSKANGPQESSTSAFAYFLTATIVSALTLAAFFYLLSRDNSKARMRIRLGTEEDADVLSGSKSIPLTRMFKKLFWLAGAVFLAFAVTMMYPVFTAQIQSVRDPTTAPRLFQPATFIPLAFLFWNTGDLLGRMIPAIPALSLTSKPRLLFILALSRVVFIPLYFLCNVKGKGASVNSDAFYLLVVQLLFGISNGYIGSSCMMGFVEWVDTDEREAAGGFMSLCLVVGLTVGSFLSFFVVG
jgi:equilibrative nucleoside transporter 1/2/3